MSAPKTLGLPGGGKFNPLIGVPTPGGFGGGQSQWSKSIIPPSPHDGHMGYPNGNPNQPTMPPPMGMPPSQGPAMQGGMGALGNALMQRTNPGMGPGMFPGAPQPGMQQPGWGQPSPMQQLPSMGLQGMGSLGQPNQAQSPLWMQDTYQASPRNNSGNGGRPQ